MLNICVEGTRVEGTLWEIDPLLKVIILRFLVWQLKYGLKLCQIVELKFQELDKFYEELTLVESNNSQISGVTVLLSEVLQKSGLSRKAWLAVANTIITSSSFIASNISFFLFSFFLSFFSFFSFFLTLVLYCFLSFLSLFLFFFLSFFFHSFFLSFIYF